MAGFCGFSRVMVGGKSEQSAEVEVGGFGGVANSAGFPLPANAPVF